MKNRGGIIYNQAFTGRLKKPQVFFLIHLTFSIGQEGRVTFFIVSAMCAFQVRSLVMEMPKSFTMSTTLIVLSPTVRRGGGEGKSLSVLENEIHSSFNLFVLC